MPRNPDPLEAKNKKWNFYVNESEKIEYLIALTKSGKQRCQSAGLRAFMYLYCNDEEVRKRTNAIIDKFLVYNESGKVSQL